jgi:hypothetical protein
MLAVYRETDRDPGSVTTGTPIQSVSKVVVQPLRVPCPAPHRPDRPAEIFVQRHPRGENDPVRFDAGFFEIPKKAFF